MNKFLKITAQIELHRQFVYPPLLPSKGAPTVKLSLRPGMAFSPPKAQ